jgi:hypothetical protein
MLPSNKEVEGSIGIRRRTLEPLIIVPQFGQAIDWLLKREESLESPHPLS